MNVPLLIVFRDRFPKKGSAALRHVAVEAVLCRLIVHCAVQRPDHGRRQGEGDIPDAHAVQMRAWIGFQISPGLFSYMMEKIGFLQVRVAEVGRQHGITSK